MDTHFIMDFNEVVSREDDLIPAGTFVKVRMALNPGGYGPEGMLSQTRNTQILYLNTVLTVTEGMYASRKIFHRFPVQGSDPRDTWVVRGLLQLRRVLESARHILPSDTSEEAQNLRKIQSYQDFNGLVFPIKVGVEKPKNAMYAPANCIHCIVTPNWPEYEKVWDEPDPMDWPL